MSSSSTLLRETEFVVIQSGPLKGKRVFGACGPNAGGGAARRAAQNDLYTTSDMVAQMYAWGLCDANGVTRPGPLNEALQRLGFTTRYSGFIEPWSQNGPTGWQAWLQHYVHDEACNVVLEVSHGQALHDQIGGKGENAVGLQYHYIALLEYHPGGHSDRAGRWLNEGYWVADGDNFAVGNVLQFYEIVTLAAAAPVAAIAVSGKVGQPVLDRSDFPAPPPVPPVPPILPPAPPAQLALTDPEAARYFHLASDGASWQRITHDASGAIQPVLDPATKQPILLSGAILSYYRSIQAGPACNGLYWPGLPLANPQPIPNVAGAQYQAFQLGALADDPAHAFDHRPGMTSSSGPVYPIHVDSGPGLAFYTAAAIGSATAALQAQVNTLQGDKASLEKQLTASQSAYVTLQQKLSKVTESVKALVGLLG